MFNFECKFQRSWIAAGATIVGAGVKIYSGIKQKQAAKKQLAGNQFSPATVPQEELDNQQLAKQMANEGLPSQQYQLGMKNIQRQQMAALRGAQDRRAGVGLIGQIQANTNDATARLDAANAAARGQNQRTLLGVNNQVAGARTRAWGLNESNRRNNFNYGMSLLGAGNANIVGGIDQGVGTTALLGNNLFGNNYNKNKFSDPSINGYI